METSQGKYPLNTNQSHRTCPAKCTGNALFSASTADGLSSLLPQRPEGLGGRYRGTTLSTGLQGRTNGPWGGDSSRLSWDVSSITHRGKSSSPGRKLGLLGAAPESTASRLEASGGGDHSGVRGKLDKSKWPRLGRQPTPCPRPQLGWYCCCPDKGVSGITVEIPNRLPLGLSLRPVPKALLQSGREGDPLSTVSCF